jgi:hypothetical protein
MLRGDELECVFFADAKVDRIYKAGVDGKVVVFKDGAGGVKALRVGVGGMLYAYQAARRQIVAYSSSDAERVVARDVDLGDMAVTGSKSTIYFSDGVHRTIGSVDASGKVRVVYTGGEIAAPSGVARCRGIRRCWW